MDKICKITAVSLIILLLTGVLTGCSQYRCRDEARKYGESAVFYAEQYLNGNISAEDAYENICAVRDELNDYCDETHNDNLNSDIKFCENMLSLDVKILVSQFLIEKWNGGRAGDIKETVSKIKEEISY